MLTITPQMQLSMFSRNKSRKGLFCTYSVFVYVFNIFQLKYLGRIKVTQIVDTIRLN